MWVSSFLVYRCCLNDLLVSVEVDGAGSNKDSPVPFSRNTTSRKPTKWHPQSTASSKTATSPSLNLAR